jgi:K+ transporter
VLMVGALGVVFGDIGTSPLYTMSAVFGGTGKGGINAAEVYGATSTLIWSMAVIVSLLYVRLLMRTDNDGEGGLLALVALLRRNVTSPRAAVLAVTGAEALYADLGHFGRKAIARAWVWIVFPALTITYLGEAAAVVRDPAAASSPFFALIPSWALWPAVVLATLATVIASQAVISGAYTVVHQGAGLGLFPPLRTQHTSRRHFGQIYTPRRRPLAVPRSRLGGFRSTDMAARSRADARAELIGPPSRGRGATRIWRTSAVRRCTSAVSARFCSSRLICRAASSSRCAASAASLARSRRVWVFCAIITIDAE